MTGTVFNIQSYSLHDGPGIRTVVFLKGCPLQCIWCANPESQRAEPEIYFDKAKCIFDKGCNRCSGKCPQNAIQNGKLNFALCDNCKKCTVSCPSKAISVYGKEMAVDEIIEATESEQAFYRHGGGGITLSGGEPLMQVEFAIELLKTAKEHYLHTAIETCGYCKADTLRNAAKYLDFIMYDVKILNDEKHIKYTGVSNKLILDNLKMLFEEFPKIPKLIRTPVIPNINEDDIPEIKKYLSQFDNYEYELLPYHRFGENKYIMLGKERPNIKI